MSKPRISGNIGVLELTLSLLNDQTHQSKSHSSIPRPDHASFQSYTTLKYTPGLIETPRSGQCPPDSTFQCRNQP